ncbi:hypothetical protein JCM5296_006223 [Sporobolomyces johnsonii]
MRRDVLLSLSCQSPTFPTLAAGLWIFHCHLAWHMAAGMAFQVSVMPNATQQLVQSMPSVFQEQCKTIASQGGRYGRV